MDAAQNYLDALANKQTLPPEAPPEPPVVDDAWIDGLTPYTPEPTSASGTSQAAQASAPAATPAQQQANLEALYKNLEHVDEDVAEELDKRIVSPRVTAVEEEVRKLREQQQAERRLSQDRIITAVNAELRAKNPKADKILGSTQFKDFVNSRSDPYASESKYDILVRAYYSGDAAYVQKELDAFVAAHGKPAPAVGVEPQTGGGNGGQAQPAQKRRMTEAEFKAARAKIRANPSAYPQGALAKLADDYLGGKNYG
uniref:Uncharacterized protein n=1 Tax=Podoviridae sp. ctlpi2 TaxID=2826574 RepID=A0A8S5MMK4_9CAUD|nr:MAG TPA: hypothetical protein [Podoviridae sp. ctlpi2]